MVKKMGMLFCIICVIVFASTTCYMILFDIQLFMKNIVLNALELLLLYAVFGITIVYCIPILYCICVKIHGQKIAVLKLYPFIYRSGLWSRNLSLIPHMSISTVFDISDFTTYEEFKNMKSKIQSSYRDIIYFVILITTSLILFYRMPNLIILDTILIILIVLYTFDKNDSFFRNDVNAFVDAILFSSNVHDVIYTRLFQNQLKQINALDAEPSTIFIMNKLLFFISRNSLYNIYVIEMDRYIFALNNACLNEQGFLILPMIFDYIDNRICLGGDREELMKQIDSLVKNMKYVPSVMKRRYAEIKFAQDMACELEISKKYRIFQS